MTDSPDLSPLEYGFFQPELLKIYLVIIVFSGFFLSISAFEFSIAMSDPGFHRYPFEKSNRMLLAFISGGFGFFVILGGIGAIIYKVVDDVLQNQQ